MSPGHDLSHLDMTELCCTHRFALCYIHVTGAMFNQIICFKLFSYLFPMTADSVCCLFCFRNTNISCAECKDNIWQHLCTEPAC